MDAADQAQEAEARFLATSLARRPSLSAGAPSIHCENCGEEIPPARRAVIGAKLCIDCQSALERLRR